MFSEKRRTEATFEASLPPTPLSLSTRVQWSVVKALFSHSSIPADFAAAEVRRVFFSTSQNSIETKG